MAYPLPHISEHIWDLKYRLKGDDGTPIDATLDDTWTRVANAAAAAEKPRLRRRWAQAFKAAMSDLAFLPAGRILAGAGTGRAVTLFNCFVMGRIEDDLGSIFSNVKEAALTMQQGGGIGHNFSTLRPKGAPVMSIGADASGPVSFMDVWDAMCRTIMSAGARRGAMMGTLRCDHPDIELFIDAKKDAARLRNFNLSVLVTDAFIHAVRADSAWNLVFNGTVYRTVSARALWERIMRATYDYAEPGVVFIDRVNARNNLAYCESISATNPCGEQPLPPYGACLLGSINLARLVVRPFESDAHLDEPRLRALVPTAVRFLDDVIDISRYPLPAQETEAKAKRRIGLGVTGLADALAMLGLRYGGPEAVAATRALMAKIEDAAYAASADLAREKGAFPLFQKDAYLAAPNVARQAPAVRKAIAEHGIRNGLLTSIAPTGTISLLAGNVSSGIEPIFSLRTQRRILARDGTTETEVVEDYAHAQFRAKFGADAVLPPAFVTAEHLAPAEHLAMQAAAQAHIDSSISKTINCPANLDFDAFKDVYLQAFDLGLKGCTTYRPNAVTGAVLTPAAPSEPDGAGAIVSPVLEQPKPAARVAARSAEGSGDVVYMAQPLARDAILSGYTYKLRWPSSDHAMYVTINDIEVPGSQGAPARRRPFEIFINSKNLEHYAWTVALTRMISAIFRRGGDVTFVVEELKAVFDPQGGQWMGGRYVPSLLAAIGEVIETHMLRTGFLAPPISGGESVGDSERQSMPLRETAIAGPASRNSLEANAPQPATKGRACPRCNNLSLHREEGCWTCSNCGYSRCG